MQRIANPFRSVRLRCAPPVPGPSPGPQARSPVSASYRGCFFSGSYEEAVDADQLRPASQSITDPAGCPLGGRARARHGRAKSPRRIGVRDSDLSGPSIRANRGFSRPERAGLRFGVQGRACLPPPQPQGQELELRSTRRPRRMPPNAICMTGLRATRSDAQRRQCGVSSFERTNASKVCPHSAHMKS